ncbi:MAG: MarR family transcriptional regulator [Alphaproteobacteria bacterium]|nr:MarR family transcriptional regulator [Alphaproteobacteria bacterium]
MQPDINAIQGLDLWHRVTLNTVRGDRPDLTARQMAVLLTVYIEHQAHTVRSLANYLEISKPAVTRALDRLCKIDLLRRRIDDSDRRSVLIERTVTGSVFLSEFGKSIQRAAEQSPESTIG